MNTQDFYGFLFIGSSITAFVGMVIGYLTSYRSFLSRLKYVREQNRVLESERTNDRATISDMKTRITELELIKHRYAFLVRRLFKNPNLVILYDVSEYDGVCNHIKLIQESIQKNIDLGSVIHRLIPGIPEGDHVHMYVKDAMTKITEMEVAIEDEAKRAKELSDNRNGLQRFIDLICNQLDIPCHKIVETGPHTSCYLPISSPERQPELIDKLVKLNGKLNTLTRENHEIKSHIAEKNQLTDRVLQLEMQYAELEKRNKELEDANYTMRLLLTDLRINAGEAMDVATGVLNNAKALYRRLKKLRNSIQAENTIPVKVSEEEPEAEPEQDAQRTNNLIPETFIRNFERTPYIKTKCGEIGRYKYVQGTNLDVYFDGLKYRDKETSQWITPIAVYAYNREAKAYNYQPHALFDLPGIVVPIEHPQHNTGNARPPIPFQSWHEALQLTTAELPQHR